MDDKKVNDELVDTLLNVLTSALTDIANEAKSENHKEEKNPEITLESLKKSIDELNEEVLDLEDEVYGPEPDVEEEEEEEDSDDDCSCSCCDGFVESFIDFFHSKKKEKHSYFDAGYNKALGDALDFVIEYFSK